MKLEALASELRGFVGITRKRVIGKLVLHFSANSDRIIAHSGEDAAVVDDGDGEILLESSDMGAVVGGDGLSARAFFFI
ncbi:MAG: hypothetical protein U9N48_08690 [Euryarchaeota archaeon]|nr:hypothetical protein [Euryarchaeota archaeon]